MKIFAIATSDNKLIYIKGGQQRLKYWAADDFFEPYRSEKNASNVIKKIQHICGCYRIDLDTLNFNPYTLRVVQLDCRF